MLLASPDVSFITAYVVQDLADLRFAFPEDAAFTSAVRSLTLELAKALQAPHAHGKPLEHDLDGWRRCAFPSSRGKHADLRLLFRPHVGAGIDVLMFGARFAPDGSSIYHRAGERN